MFTSIVDEKLFSHRYEAFPMALFSNLCHHHEVKYFLIAPRELLFLCSRVTFSIERKRNNFLWNCIQYVCGYDCMKKKVVIVITAMIQIIWLLIIFTHSLRDVNVFEL